MVEEDRCWEHVAVRLVQTLVVRDEADIVDAQISFHLSAGVDFVIATDHGSQDGTREILESYARAGHLRLTQRQGVFHEEEWRTTMARLAATEHQADWVVNTDADEFWMPREGTLKEMFGGVPERFGVVWGLSRHFIPRPDDERNFAERMVTRLSQQAPVNDPTSPFRPHAKVAHRATPEIVVRHGAHLVHAPSLEPMRDRYPADVLHFPIRSRRQYEHKGVRGVRDSKPLGQYVRAALASQSGRAEGAYDALVIDDASLERGINEGFLREDTRLRDALRSIDLAESTHWISARTVRPSIVDRVEAIVEGSSLREADLVRLRRRLDMLDSRVSRAERPRRSARGRSAAA
jgi:Glycosyl transferase family 2